jgi:hypothetical protein
MKIHAVCVVLLSSAVGSLGEENILEIVTPVAGEQIYSPLEPDFFIGLQGDGPLSREIKRDVSLWEICYACVGDKRCYSITDGGLIDSLEVPPIGDVEVYAWFQQLKQVPHRFVAMTKVGIRVIPNATKDEVDVSGNIKTSQHEGILAPSSGVARQQQQQKEAGPAAGGGPGGAASWPAAPRAFGSLAEEPGGNVVRWGSILWKLTSQSSWRDRLRSFAVGEHDIVVVSKDSSLLSFQERVYERVNYVAPPRAAAAAAEAAPLTRFNGNSNPRQLTALPGRPKFEPLLGPEDAYPSLLWDSFIDDFTGVHQPWSVDIDHLTRIPNASWVAEKLMVGNGQRGAVSLGANAQEGGISKSSSRFYVNVGAGDGKLMDPLYELHAKGWSGLAVETRSMYASRARENLGPFGVQVHQGLLTAVNVKSVFQQYLVPDSFDLLKVDIDNADCHLVDSILEVCANNAMATLTITVTVLCIYLLQLSAQLLHITPRLLLMLISCNCLHNCNT